MKRRGRAGAGIATFGIAAAALGAGQAAAADTMAVQPDGGIVVVGQIAQLQKSCGPREFGRDCPLYPRVWPALARFDSDGTPDLAFGHGGGVLDFRGNPLGGSFASAAVEGGGRILVGSGNRLMRFESDGSVDTSFAESAPAAGTILPQADGSIIVGTYRSIGIKDPDSSITVIRLDADGKSRQTIGTVRSESILEPLGLVDLLQQGDSLLAASTFEVLRFRPAAGPAPDMGFAGGRGAVLPGGDGPRWRITAIAPDSGGFLVAGIPAAGSEPEDRPAVARFDAGGILDSTFGVNGVVRLDQAPPRSSVAAIVAGPGPTVTIVGQRRGSCPAAPFRRWKVEPCSKAFVQRIEPGAAAAGPAVDLPLPRAQGVDASLTADGGLIVSASPRAGAASHFAVLRLRADGSLDPGFGEGGMTVFNPCRGSASARRRSGCIGSTSPRLRLGGRRIRGRLELSTSDPLDPIVATRLLLPAGLAGIPETSGTIRATTVPRRAASARVEKDRVAIKIYRGVRDLSIDLRAGALRRTGRVAPGHKLVFRVLATFADGSTQRIPIRLAP